MRSGGRTRAANRPASSQSRPPHALSNGHTGQRLSEVGRVSCRVKPSFQLPLHVRLGISLTSNAVRLTAIRTPLRTDPRADLKILLRQHHYLACRKPNKDFEQTHLRRRILLWDGSTYDASSTRRTPRPWTRPGFWQLRPPCGAGTALAAPRAWNYRTLRRDRATGPGPGLPEVLRSSTTDPSSSVNCTISGFFFWTFALMMTCPSTALSSASRVGVRRTSSRARA